MLVIDNARGYAWETGDPMTYGADYWHKYIGYENTLLGLKLNQFRVGLVQRYAQSVLDIGIGSGIFLRDFPGQNYGYDVNPLGQQWLMSSGRWLDPYTQPISTQAITFWDSIEHIQHPEVLLSRIPPNVYLMASLPIFDDISQIAKSKHYRPVGEGGGVEHYHYFTREGFIMFLEDNHFHVIEMLDTETKLGRESTKTFVGIKKM